MTIAPLPGVTTQKLLDTLSERLEALEAVAGMTASGPELQSHYLRWASKTSETLRRMVSPADLDWLVAPQSIWRVASITPDGWNREIVLGIARSEVDNRIALFTTARDELRVQVERWMNYGGRLIVPDSSLFITHPTKLEEIDLADALQAGGAPLRLVIPIIVIDELDGLKRSGDGQVRWRAAYTLAVLDRLLSSGVGPVRVREAVCSDIDGGRISQGEITVEVLFDPPNHVRLPINDDEIIDRARSVGQLAGRPVTVVTYDTGQSMRARAVGLEARKLRKPLEEERKQASPKG